MKHKKFKISDSTLVRYQQSKPRLGYTSTDPTTTTVTTTTVTGMGFAKPENR